MNESCNVIGLELTRRVQLRQKIRLWGTRRAAAVKVWLRIHQNHLCGHVNMLKWVKTSFILEDKSRKMLFAAALLIAGTL